MVVIFCENFYCADPYRSGIYAQELYMACEHHNTGHSRIGAFYDDEALRWSDKPLLYAVAIGGKSMIIGVPKRLKRTNFIVGMTPSGVMG